MYLEDGSDAHRCLKSNIRKIFNTEEDRDVYDIIDSQYDSWTGESIDKRTGEIFMLRGDYWYSAKRSYDEDSGEILDTYGEVQYDENSMIDREIACREDVTGEYIQYFDAQKYWEQSENQVNSTNRRISMFLGQDELGCPIENSVGHIIEAYPIKPYSVFLYVNGDEDIIADNGCGKLSGTPGILNGWGTIDYDTGEISFSTNIDITSVNIMYKVYKFTYSHYVNFDTTKLFVRPEYIRSDNRK